MYGFLTDKIKESLQNIECNGKELLCLAAIHSGVDEYQMRLWKGSCAWCGISAAFIIWVAEPTEEDWKEDWKEAVLALRSHAYSAKV